MRRRTLGLVIASALVAATAISVAAIHAAAVGNPTTTSSAAAPVSVRDGGTGQIDRSPSPTPDLYVSTGYERGALYRYPDFPAKIGIDNHDYFSELQWTKLDQGRAKATGTLHENNCEPNCSVGTYLTYPIEILASDPQRCTVTVYTNYTDSTQLTGEYVFNRISVRALSGNPSSFLVGESVFSAPCT